MCPSPLSGVLKTYIPRRGAASRLHGHSPVKNLQRRADRRIIFDGYPIEPRQFTRDEIEAYFAGDRIVCLMCGRTFKCLGTHLKNIHSMTQDEYRERYSLPYRRGLTSGEFLQRMGAVIRADEKRMAHARRLAADPVILALRQEAVHHQRKTPEYKERMTARIRPYSRTPFEVQLTAEDYERVLTEIAKGKTVKEVVGQPGFPGETMWFKYRREHPDYNSRFEAIWDALPYEVQARGQRLSQRFIDDVRKWSAEGMTVEEISRRVGVSSTGIRKALKRFFGGIYRDRVGAGR